MNGSQRPSGEATHHRLLEGVLLRLARLPDGGDLILRGGMLMRLWFRPLDRPAGDLDLVSAFPFSVRDTARRFGRLLADRGVDDGVTFDPQRFRAEAIWLDTPFPGVRLFASGAVDGVEDEFTVDVSFGEALVPEPQRGEYPVPGRGLAARLRMCRPETIVGRKLHALGDMGVLHWRPKDLNDLRLLLERVPLDPAALPEAIAVSFTNRGNTTAEARALFDASWWAMKTSTARWQDFVRESPGQEVPASLARVVAEVAGRLGPILERLP